MKRRIILTAFAVAFMIAMGFFVLRGQRTSPEPIYQGKMLSQWLEIYDPANTNRSSQSLRETQSAIRQMGTNAIPTLLRMLESRDSKLKLWAVNLARRQHLVEIHFVQEMNRYERAAMAFEVLGARAESAVPELIRIYDQNPSPAAQGAIARVLGLMGPPAKAAVPSLLRGATSTNYVVQGNAIYALGKIQADPENTVPVLIKALQDPYLIIQINAASALGSFGPDAKSAVPALVKFLESNGPSSQPAAGLSLYNAYQIGLEALRSIDPEAAAKFSSTNTAFSPPPRSP